MTVQPSARPTPDPATPKVAGSLIAEMTVVCKEPGPLGLVREVAVTEELEPIGYLRVWRRTSGDFFHVAKWNVLSVSGVPS